MSTADAVPEAAELPALLRVPEPQQREGGVPEQLRRDPAAGEERNRLTERRHHTGHVHQQDEQPELERAERQRRPARLVRERAVIDLHVESKTDPEHEAHGLHGPPAMLRERQRDRNCEHEHERREPRLDAPPQRVRHDVILSRNPWAT